MGSELPPVVPHSGAGTEKAPPALRRPCRFCQERGIEIYCQEVAHPEWFDDVERYREMLFAKGIVLAFGPFKGKYMGRPYPASYNEEEIEVFNLRKKAAKGAQFNQKGSLCSAGYNVAVAGPDGMVNPCYDVRENLGNMFGSIRLQPEVGPCPVVCSCPLSFYDEPLFGLALSKREQRMGVANGSAWPDLTRTPLGTAH